MIAPCADCAPQYDYELGPGFDSSGKECDNVTDTNDCIVPSVFELHMKYINPGYTGYMDTVPFIFNELDKHFETLEDILISKHGSDVEEREAIDGLFRYIKSIQNEEEVISKMHSCTLIPEHKMMNIDWSSMDWDWVTNQLNNGIYDDRTFNEQDIESIRNHIRFTTNNDDDYCYGNIDVYGNVGNGSDCDGYDEYCACILEQEQEHERILEQEQEQEYFSEEELPPWTGY